jgi:hypothetical protein
LDYDLHRRHWSPSVDDAAGVAPFAFIAFTALEIVGAPLFILWQFRVSKLRTEACP